MYAQWVEAYKALDITMYDFTDDEKYAVELGGTLIEDNDEEDYDSYGNEDSRLERIYRFPTYDCYVKFYGTRQSHNGTEWDGYMEVKPAIKTVNYYEEI